MIHKLSLLSIVFIAHTLSATVVQEFSFPLGTHALYRPFGQLYVGASQSRSKNDLALAVAGRTDSAFRGIAPEKVVLNNQADSINPLNGAAIEHLVLLERRPVAVPVSLPSSLFLVEERSKPIEVFQSPPINNALGEQAPSILALTTTASQLDVSLDAGASLAAIGAVPNAQGSFDGDGSGIAVAWFRQVAQKDKSFFAWDIVDAVTGVSSFPDSPAAQRSGNKAAPFGKDTQQLMISTPVEAIAPKVDLHFDRELGRLYIATQVTAGNSAQAGARGVVVASLANGRLQYHAIAPDSVFEGSDQIVGTRGAGSRTQIFKVRTMQTKTYLRYLIVVGGNGDTATFQQKVFALPLVDNIAFPETHGTLAHVQAQPVTLFGEQAPHRFKARVFAVPAQKPQDVYTIDSTHAQVGGQGILPGPISDIHIAGEAVFVSCLLNDALNTDKLAPGIFYSQPVFDQVGRISGWTNWQRVAHAAESITGFAYDSIASIFWSFPKVAPQKVLRTQWTDGSDELSIFVTGLFSKEKGGVQGLFDFPLTTQGFSSTVSERIAVQLYTGFNTVLMCQTGKQQNGLFGPYEKLEDTFVSVDGSLKGFSEASNLALSHGELDNLGPITSAAVLSDGVTGWIVVAGVGGVAVLADAQGIGWDAKKGLGSRFAGLSKEASWKRISSTPFVRKLVVQDGQLFVLSQSALERFSFSAQELALGSIQKVTLAQLTSGQKGSELSYSDLHLKGPLALLATSFGLLRSGNGSDVRIDMQVSWIPVPLKESVGSLSDSGPVIRLFSIIPSEASAQDSIYLLNGFVGLNQGLIYRLIITVRNGQVTDESVKLFPDYILKDTNSFFTHCGDYRNYLVTDGSLLALSRSAFGGNPPLLQLLSPTLKSGESSRARVPFMSLPEDAGTIGLLLRNSASGAWLVHGDFGVRVQR
jgi:hypothetical protein